MSKTIYVLGAGASRDSGIPLTNEILKVAIKMKEDYSPDKSPLVLDISHFDSFFKFLGDVFGWDGTVEMLPDLNELLGLLEIGTKKHSSFYGLFSAYESSTDIKNHLLHIMYNVLTHCTVKNPFQVEYKISDNKSYDILASRLSDDDVIISLNYDTGIDEAVSKLKTIDYGIDPRNQRDWEQRRDKPKKKQLILKLHGSFNWIYCPTCDIISYFGSFPHNPFFGNEEVLCEYCHTSLEHVIVPPSLVKTYENSHLLAIWQKASNELRNSERVIFIGYSLSGADIEVKYLFKQSISIHRLFYKGKQSEIEVVNPSEKSINAYKKWFGSKRIISHKMNLSEYLESKK